MEEHPPITIPDAAKARLRALGVVAVYLIGSRARGSSTQRSDYDFAVILDRAARATDPDEYPEIHRALYDILTDAVSPSDAAGPLPGRLRDVDVVFLQRAPLYYATHAVRYGRLLYDGDPRARVRFEEHARRLVMDFFPLRQRLEQALLASL